MIPQSFIQDLLNRLDIVDVIERYLPLKRAGANYTACCPFHSEKTPSFTVSPTKQFYHCFGCGVHGSAIGFVMEYSGLNFIEAVKELAASVGMQAPEDKFEKPRSPNEQGPDLREILQQAARYYREQLKQSPAAIAYLKKRGLTGETAARFGIGFAPPGWQNLQAVFPDYKSRALLDAGLVIEGEEGRRYDRFRERIMFPIVNQKGMIVGFGGRVLDQGEPKYMNSPETPVFEKGRELYGLHSARQAIRAAGRVIVVEGYMDVVALAQHGIGYGVATLGTATTPFHVQKLLRQSEQVVFCFDGDEAGRRAAWRAVENSLSQLTDGKQVSFLFLPEGDDPDTYVRNHGKEAFEDLVKRALPLSAFLFQELAKRVDLQTQEGRAKLLKDARPLVTQVNAPALGLMLRKRLAELASIGQGELERLYDIQVVGKQRPVPARRAHQAPSLARELMRGLLEFPQLALRCDNQDLPRSGDPDARTLAALLEFIRSHPQIQTAGAILEGFRGTEHEKMLKVVLDHAQDLGTFDAGEIEREFLDGIEQMRHEHERQEASTLLAQTSLADLSPDMKERLKGYFSGRGQAISKK